jgi:allophanate hydrolase subunit 2
MGIWGGGGSAREEEVAEARVSTGACEEIENKGRSGKLGFGCVHYGALDRGTWTLRWSLWGNPCDEIADL